MACGKPSCKSSFCSATNIIVTMSTWKIVLNVFLIIVILVASIGIIVDYRKHKDDESISPEDLKKLRRWRCEMP